MRIAWIDLLFSWPARGGADVDAYHVLRELQRLGHDVKLFGAGIENCGERGLFEAETQPFPAEHLSFPEATFTPSQIVVRFEEAVTAYAPDLVVVGDAFFLKPYLLQAFAARPTCARFYAHELICHRDILRFRDGAACPQHYLQTPEICRACAFEQLKPQLRQGRNTAWTREYAITKAYDPDYYEILKKALATVDCCIVYNPDMAQAFTTYCAQTAVITGGVDLSPFTAVPPPRAATKRIYLPGRAEDPAKGLQVLLEAGELLRAQRDDFVMQATMPWRAGLPDWFEALPWRPFEEHLQQYQQADICVVPSLWEEPFGLTAVEAMAAARPVCASQTGGLQQIVQHETTGLLFPPGDVETLATCLARLLEDPVWAQALGAAGRLRAETTYSWRNVVESGYIPLFKQLCQQAR